METCDGILEKIQGPRDLKALSAEDPRLPAEAMRDFLNANFPRTGGRFASNPGDMEPAIALPRRFDSPRDAIVRAGRARLPRLRPSSRGLK